MKSSPERKSLGEIVEEFRINRKVSKEARKKAEENGNSFKSRFISFLSENPSATLAPLLPTDTQLQTSELLVQFENENQLPLSQKESEVREREVILYLRYLAGIEEGGFETQAFLHCLWNISRDSSDIIFINGRSGHLLPPVYFTYPHLPPASTEITGFVDPMSFLAFPSLIETPEQAVGINPYRLSSGNGFEREINIIDSGRKMAVRTSIYNGRIWGMENYYLLGKFEGEKGENWIYGSNTKHHYGARLPATSPSRSLKFNPVVRRA